MVQATAEPVSLVVPLYNEEASVELLLTALAAQTCPPSEVVLVDAGSTDRTADRIRAFSAPFPLRLVQRGRLNPGEARNEGIALASHEWIALTDGGIRPEPTWLQELLAGAGPDVDVVFGSYEPVCDTMFRRCAALAYVPPRSSQGIRGPFVASMALRREVFETVGGFPRHRASEDLVFIEGIIAGKLRVAFAPRAVVHWETAPDVRSTFRRFALYSEVNLQVGRGRFWHFGLARQYALLLALLLVAYVAGGGPWSWVLVPAWLAARLGNSAWRKRGDLPFRILHPVHLAGAALLLLVLDFATLFGAVAWLRKRPVKVRA